MADDKEEVESPEIHFEPIVKLDTVEISTLEEDEESLLKMRAKLFRYASELDPPEWKERGVGDIKVLKHKSKGTCRILMRRDKTLKVCANHYVSPTMELKPNCGSDRAWVWSTRCDFADEEPKPELLAVRFANAENAQKFKAAFQEAQKIMEAIEYEKSPAKGDTLAKVSDATSGDKTENDKSNTAAGGASGESADQSSSDNTSKDKIEDKSDKDSDNIAKQLEEMKVKDESKTVNAADCNKKDSTEAER